MFISIKCCSTSRTLPCSSALVCIHTHIQKKERFCELHFVKLQFLLLFRLVFSVCSNLANSPSFWFWYDLIATSHESKQGTYRRLTFVFCFVFESVGSQISFAAIKSRFWHQSEIYYILPSFLKWENFAFLTLFF